MNGHLGILSTHIEALHDEPAENTRQAMNIAYLCLRSIQNQLICLEKAGYTAADHDSEQSSIRAAEAEPKPHKFHTSVGSEDFGLYLSKEQWTLIETALGRSVYSPALNKADYASLYSLVTMALED